jgi:hypothetical protein
VSGDTLIVISIVLYKISTLAAGVALSFMGYRLFMAGIWGESGNIEAKVHKYSLVIAKAAPGTFFALFGAIVVVVSLYRGLDYQLGESVAPPRDGTRLDLPATPPK